MSNMTPPGGTPDDEYRLSRNGNRVAMTLFIGVLIGYVINAVVRPFG